LPAELPAELLAELPGEMPGDIPRHAHGRMQGMSEAAPVRLAPGDPAPDFTLPDADGNPVSLAEHRGRRVIVYFYPAALTPGCTTQAVDFTAAAGDLAQAGLDIIGISPDEPGKLVKFRDKEQLGITLLSDPEKKVLKAYGAYGLKKLYGKEVEGVIRSTFIVDAEGRIEQASYNVKATGHVAKLRRELGLG
jgi:peroxiredoxin Q/BCP